MPGTVVVTGGAGFIGSHVVEALLNRGERVVVIDDFNDFYDPAIKRANVAPFLARDGFRLVEADIRDAEAMRAALAEAAGGRLIHLAARAGVRPSIANPELYEAVNVRGTKTVLDAARQSGIRHAVVASSSSVYGERADGNKFEESDPLGEPRSPYAKTKQQMERLAENFSRESGMTINMLRFFTVYGPAQRPDMAIAKFTEAIANDRPIQVFGDGSARRDFTYVDDIVNGILGALDHVSPDAYRVYNLGESKTATVTEMIKDIEQALGKQAVVEHLPASGADVSATFANVDRAVNELGYHPTTSLDQGIAKYVTWYKSQH